MELIVIFFSIIVLITGIFFNIKQNIKIKRDEISIEELIDLMQKQYGDIYSVKKKMGNKLWIQKGLIAVSCVLKKKKESNYIDLQYESEFLMLFGIIPTAFAVWGGKKILKNIKSFIENSNELQTNAWGNFTSESETATPISSNNISLEEMQQIRDEFGIVDDNYTIVTKMIAYYYMELISKYKNRFTDDISLLATVGVLDAQIYVFQEKNITIQEIIHLAKISVTKRNPLLEFTLHLGILISTLENPNFSTDEIKYAWNSEKDRLELLNDEIKKYYPRGTKEEELVTHHSNLFLNSPQTKIFRNEIGLN